MDFTGLYTQENARCMEKLVEMAKANHAVVDRYTLRMGEDNYLIAKSVADRGGDLLGALIAISLLAFEIGFVKGQRAAAINGVNIYAKDGRQKAQTRRKRAAV